MSELEGIKCDPFLGLCFIPGLCLDFPYTELIMTSL